MIGFNPRSDRAEPLPTQPHCSITINGGRGNAEPGGLIRLLEYVRPRGKLRRIISRMWQPWIAWAYGASFDRETERRVPEAGLQVVESRYVVNDLLKLITVRASA